MCDNISGIDFKNMPPCKKVLLNKIKRTCYLSQIMQRSNQGAIERPDDGWILTENNELEIDYFVGNPFPDNITNTSIDENIDENEDDAVCEISSSEDESEVSDDSDVDWNPENE